jgi:hypothetical protein
LLGTKEAEMRIRGVDFQPRQQAIAMLDGCTGELAERNSYTKAIKCGTSYSALEPAIVGIDTTMNNSLVPTTPRRT